MTGAARQDPESVIISSKAPTCPNPGASHVWGIKTAGHYGHVTFRH